MSNLFIGIKGCAVCISKETGLEKWRTKLKSLATITNICFDENNIYAYASGHLFCLDPETGSIKWENGLKGLSHSYCIIASQADQQQIVAASSNNKNTTAPSSN